MIMELQLASLYPYVSGLSSAIWEAMLASAIITPVLNNLSEIFPSQTAS
ncbi:MAG: hypothetical protein ACLUAO_04550 [Streptococcus sp.]